MKTINCYFINLALVLCMNFCILQAEGNEGKESDKESSTKSEDNDEQQKKKAQKNQSSNNSYLEKIRRRYVSRLPYLMIPIMVVPVIKKGEIVGYLTVMTELKGNSVKSYRKLQEDTVKIRDEIFCDLYFAMSRLWLGPEPPSPAVLENRIKKRINQYYKEELAEKARLHVMQLSLIRKL